MNPPQENLHEKSMIIHNVLQKDIFHSIKKSIFLETIQEREEKTKKINQEKNRNRRRKNQRYLITGITKIPFPKKLILEQHPV